MKNWMKRAIRTFAQTAIGYIAINVPLVNWDNENDYFAKALIGVSVSAVAAGLSAVMNIIDDMKSDDNNKQ